MCPFFITLMERTNELKEAYNDFWCKLLKSKEDFYSKMSLGDFVELKKVVSNIHNIITLEVTKSFVDFLVAEGIVSKSQALKINNNVELTNANTNGFDIQYPSDDATVYADGEPKIIAEVKCCIPVKEDSYGAAQEHNILIDIRGLHEGKRKSKIEKQDLQHYLKFLVLLGGSHDDQSAIKNVNASALRLINKANTHGWKVELYQPHMDLNCSTVYVVILNY